MNSLTRMPDVKNKNCEGELFFYTDRICWLPFGMNPNTLLALKLFYVDIKDLRVSSDIKSTVQLQTILHSGGSHKFHFVNPRGKEAQLADRCRVKDLLLQMLCTIKKENDLKKRERILQENKDLRKLYQTVVVGGILSADEFWSSMTSTTEPDSTVKQQVAISIDFLRDACNEMKVHGNPQQALTTDLINSIFKTFPAVERLFRNNVPDRMLENNFWSEFFKSEYFDPDETDEIGINNKKLFAGCMCRDIKALNQDQVVTMAGKKHKFQYLSDEFKADPKYSPSANTCLIRRLNHFSIMVANSNCHPSKARDSPNADPTEKIETKDTEGRDGDIDNDQVINELTGPDVETSPPASTTPNQAPYLKTSNAKRRKVDHENDNPTNEISGAVWAFRQDVMDWQTSSTHQLPFDPEAALHALQDLSCDFLMQGPSTQSFKTDSLPKELLPELKSIFREMRELLRSLRECFPATGKELEIKAVLMEHCLKIFQESRVHAFSNKITPYRRTVDISDNSC